jgi:hypothetical protein
MFVQYSFVQRRPSPIKLERHPFEPSPAVVIAAGIAFMAATSLFYALG